MTVKAESPLKPNSDNEKEINLYVIYEKVCNRKNRGSIAPGARRAAHVAAEAASIFISDPTQANLKNFELAERKWAELASNKGTREVAPQI